MSPIISPSALARLRCRSCCDLAWAQMVGMAFLLCFTTYLCLVSFVIMGLYHGMGKEVGAMIL
jgi:hypothetical protein